jgi:hypothetical protein
MTSLPGSTWPLRRLVYTLLIAVAGALAAGHILSAQRVYEPGLSWPAKRPAATPMFGSNDRSRWAMVRALVDEGTFVIGRRDHKVFIESAAATISAADPLQLAVLQTVGFQERVGSDTGIVFEDGWQSIDKVLHPTRLEFYSSKPPLLPVLVAGEYWLLQKATGWTLQHDTFELVRFILLTINCLPFVLYLIILARLVERYGTTDWSRLFVLTAGAFGTLVTPFLITFNNHTIAAVATLLTLAGTLRIWRGANHVIRHPPEARARDNPSLVLPAGVDQHITAARDNPSLALRATVGQEGVPHPVCYALTGLAAGFAVSTELPAAAFAVGVLLVLLLCSVKKTLLYFVPAALVPIAALLLTNYLELGQWRPAYSEFGGPWYQYEGSRWRDTTNRGIDLANDSLVAYTFHLLLGHHGVFSLTPIFLLTLAATVALCWRMPKRFLPGADAIPEAHTSGLPGTPLPWLLFPATLVLSVVVIGYYILQTNNYGGVSAGPRWLLWLTPLWLVTMLPAVEWLERRRIGKAVTIVLLVLSVLSASFAPWNPWRHPWIYNYLDAHGLIPY